MTNTSLLASFLCAAVAAISFDPLPIFAGFVALGLATFRWSRQSPLAFASPVVLILLSAMLYSLPLPVSHYLGLPLFLNRAMLIDLPEFYFAFWLCLLSALALLLGAHLVRPFGSPPPTYSSCRISAQSGWLLLAVGGAAALILLLYSGGTERVAALRYGERYSAIGASAPLKIGNSLISAAFVTFFYAYRTRRTALCVLGLLAAGGTLLLDALIWEKRTPVIAALVGSTLILEVTKRTSRPNWRAVALGVVLVGLIPISGHFRGGGTIDNLSPRNLNLANHEFGSVFLTNVDISRRFQSTDDLLLGASYARAFGVLVPSAIWPDRPMSIPNWYVQEHYRALARRGGGLAFSPVAEAYMNFGIFGVVLVFFLFGIAVSAFESYLVARIAVNTAWAVGLGILGPWLLGFYRLDFGSFLKLGIAYGWGLFVGLCFLQRALGWRRSGAQGAALSTRLKRRHRGFVRARRLPRTVDDLGD